MDVASFWFDSAASCLYVVGYGGDSFGVSVGQDGLGLVAVNSQTGTSDGQTVSASAVQTIKLEMGSGFGADSSSGGNFFYVDTSAFSSLGSIELVLDDPTGCGANAVVDDGGAGITFLLDGLSGQNVLDAHGAGHVYNPNGSSGSTQDGNGILIDGGGTNTLFGATGFNILDGTTGSNTLVDGGGTNTLNGGSGTDILNGAGDGSGGSVGTGGGYNTLNGGSGNETLYGGSNTNVLNDGGGTNVLYGGSGTNTLNGSHGTNTLNGSPSTNILNDGGGTNILKDGGGLNTLNAQSGTNTLYGNAGGTNILNAGGGNNTLYGCGTLYSPSGISITGSGSGYNLTNNAAESIALGVNADASGNVTLTSGNNTFVGGAGPITSSNAGHMSLAKSGAGTATLSGANVYDGPTTVSTGSLVLAGDASLGNTAIEVTGGATLAANPGSATISAGSTGTGTAGATLSLDAGSTFSMNDGATGTFQFNHQSSFSGTSLGISGATFNFDLNSTHADLLATTGAAAVSGTNTINITPLGSSLSVGQNYQLITAASGLSGSFVFSNGATSETVVVNRQAYTLTLTNSASVELLTVSNGAIYWVGTAGSANWNTTTANWSSTSGGPANVLYSDGDAVIFDNRATRTSVTVSGNVTPSTLLFQNDSSHALTITDVSSSSIGGSTTLTVAGGGSLTLLGTNSYTGVTTITAGTLQLGDGTSINGSVGGDIADNGSLIFADSSTQTFSGAISGSGSLTKTGSGALTLSGSSTYAGATTVSAGSLKGGTDSAWSANSAVSVASAASLDLAGHNETIGALSGSGTVTNSVGSTNIALTSNGSGTFGGTLQNGGSGRTLALKINGSEILSGSNTYTGGTWINGGSLTLANAQAIADGTTISDNGTLDLDGQHLDSTIALAFPTSGSSSGALINSNTATAIVDGPISGNGMVAGSNAITLDGNLSSANLTFKSSNRVLLGVGSTLHGVTVVSGTLKLGGSNAIGSNMTVSLDGGTLDLAGQGISVSDSITGSGTLINSGASMHLAATVAGSVTVEQGHIVFDGDLHQANLSVISNGEADINGGLLPAGTTVDEIAGLDIESGVVAFNMNTSVNSGVRANGGTIELNGHLASDTSIYCRGGTLDLNGADLSSPISGYGTLTNSGSAAHIHGPVYGGFTVAGSAANIGFDGDLSQANLTFSADGASISTLGGSTASLGGLDVDNGHVQLNSQIDVPSGVYVGGGTFQLNQTLASTTTIHLSGGTLDLHGVNLASPIDGYGTLINSSAPVTISGAILGSFTFAGSGGITLDGNMSQANLTIALDAGYDTVNLGGNSNAPIESLDIESGTLQLNTSIEVSSSVTLNSGTFDLNGHNASFGDLAGSAGSISNSASAPATLTVGTDNSSSTTFGGNIYNGSGSVALTKAGTGTTVLTGSNYSAGAITISGGALQFGDDSTVGYVASNIVDGGTLIFDVPSGATTYSGVISGSGSLTKIGAGTLNLTNANTYTGGTTVSGGTLQLGDGSSNTGSVPDNIVVGGGATLATADSGTLVLGGLTLDSSATLDVKEGELDIDTAPTLSGFSQIMVDAPGILHLAADPNDSSTGPSIGVGVSAVVAHGATVELGGSVAMLADANNRVAVWNDGTLLVSGANQKIGGIDGAGTLTVSAGSGLTADFIRQAILTIHGTTSSFGSVQIRGDQTPVAHDTARTSMLGSISIDNNEAAPGSTVYYGTLDMMNNDLIVAPPDQSETTAPSDYSDVNDMVRSGQASDHSWTGRGITSSTAAYDQQHKTDSSNPTTGMTALGVILNDDGSHANSDHSGSAIWNSWDGFSNLTQYDTLVKYTYRGDTKLRGTVDSSDAGRVATIGTSGVGWRGGDFFYQGSVTILDTAAESSAEGNVPTAVTIGQLIITPVPYDPTHVTLTADDVAAWGDVQQVDFYLGAAVPADKIDTIYSGTGSGFDGGSGSSSGSGGGAGSGSSFRPGGWTLTGVDTSALAGSPTFLAVAQSTTTGGGTVRTVVPASAQLSQEWDWDADGLVSNNRLTNGLGGTGHWQTLTQLWQYNGTEQTYPQNAVGAAAYFKDRAGTVTVDSQVTTADIYFQIAYYNIQGGQINLANSSANIDVPATADDTIGSVLAGSAVMNKTNGGVLTLTGSNDCPAGVTISAGYLEIGDGTANVGSVAGNIYVASGAALIFAVPAGMTETYSGVISGTGSVWKEGAGKLILSGANTYSGGTTVYGSNWGTIVANGSTSLGTGAVSLLSGGELDLGPSVTLANQITGLVGTGAGGGGALVGAGSAASGLITLGGPATISNLTVSGGMNSGSGAATVTFAGTNTLNTGALADGGGALSVAVNGSLTVNSHDTYSGATTVNNGGSLTMGSAASLGNTAIHVAYGGTLDAQTGSTTIYAGNPSTGSATLALDFGSTFCMSDGATGTFSVQQSSTSAAGLTLGGANLSFDVGASSADKLAVAGIASVSGTNIVNVNVIGSSVSSSYTLITASSGLNSGGNFVFLDGQTMDSCTLNGQPYTLTLNRSNTAVTLSVASVSTTPDAAIVAAADQALGLSASATPTTAQWAQLTSLTVDSSHVTSLNGIANATNLQSLTLVPSDFSQDATRASLPDLSPLSKLTQLTSLTLQGCGITDAVLGNPVSALPTFAHLQTLDLRYNNFSSVPTSVANEPALTSLFVYGNPLSTSTSAPWYSNLSGKLLTVDIAPNNPQSIVANAASIVAAAQASGASYQSAVNTVYQDLAGAFYKLPIEIYQYLVNTIQYQPYRGAMKGPLAVLETGAGNDWDTDSLLVQLMAAAGASGLQYATSQVTDPIGAVENWLGVQTSSAVYNVLNLAGLNPTVSSSYATFDHTWLEGTIGAHPVVLDPTWKQFDYQAGLPDMLNSAAFDQTGYLAAPQTQSAAEYYENQVRKSLASSGAAQTIADVPYTGLIRQHVFTSLPAASAHWSQSSKTLNSAIPSQDQYFVQIAVADPVPGCTVSGVSQYNASTHTTTITCTVAAFDSTLVNQSLLFIGESSGEQGFQIVKYDPAQPNQLVVAGDATGAAVGNPVALSLTTARENLADISLRRLTVGYTDTGYWNTVSTYNSFGNLVTVTSWVSTGFVPHVYLDGAADPNSLSVGSQRYRAGYGESMNVIVQVFAGGAPADAFASAGYSFSNGSYSKVYSRPCGKYMAVGLDANQTSQQMLTSIRQTVNSAEISQADSQSALPTWINQNAANKDHLIGGLLQLAAIQYFNQCDAGESEIAGLTGAVPFYNLVASGLATSDWVLQPAAASALQFPYLPTGMGIDVPSNSWAGISINDDHSQDLNRDLLMGYQNSSMEGLIWEELTNYDSISTVKAFQLEQQQNAQNTFLTITSSNDDTNTLNGELHYGVNNADNAHLIADIQAAVSSGFTARVPTYEVIVGNGTHGTPNPKGPWTGIGYMLVNSAGLTQGFVIDGAINGVWDAPHGGAGAGDEKSADNVSLSANTAVVGDPINTANGDAIQDATDVSVPNLGAPLGMSRHYDSFDTPAQGQTALPDRGMGDGWSFMYSDTLAPSTTIDGPQPANTMVWFTDTGMRLAFKPANPSNPTAGYITPDTIFGALGFNTSTSTYTWTDKTGATITFSNGGSGTYYVTQIKDRYGNGVNISRSGATISTVTAIDPSHPSDTSRYLSFSYTGNHVTSITDYTIPTSPRTWTYGYDSSASTGRLISVTAPVASGEAAVVTQYAYFDTTASPSPALHDLLQSVIDANGNKTQFTYYANRRGFQVTDTLGNSQSFSYNLFRNRTAATNENDQTTLYDYDKDGNVLQQLNPDQTTTTATWLNDLKQTDTDEYGQTETFVHGDPNYPENVTSFTDRLGRTTTTAYSAPGANGTTTAFGQPLVVNTSSFGGDVTSYSYNSDGSLHQSIEDANDSATWNYIGNYTTYTYPSTSRGEPLTVTAPDAHGATDGSSYTTTYAYNSAGQTTSTTTQVSPSLSITRSWAFDGHGNLTSSTDGNGNVTNYPNYDPLDRLIAEQQPDPDNLAALGTNGPLVQPQTNFTYDANGNLTQTMLATASAPATSLRTTTASYDGLNRTVKSVNPDGTYTTAEFDPAGNLIYSTDALGRVTQYVYDSRDRKIAEIDPVPLVAAGGTVGSGLSTTTPISAWRYDGGSRVVATTDPNGNTTQFTYDALGRNLKTILPDPDGSGPLTAATTVTKYDDANDKMFVTDALGSGSTDTAHTTETDYNHLGEVVAVIQPAPSSGAARPTTVYTYDDNRNVLTVTDPLGHETNYVYDQANRKTAEINVLVDSASDDLATQFFYDNNGNLQYVVNAAYPNNHQPYIDQNPSGYLDANSPTNDTNHFFTTTYVYDNLNRKVKEIDPSPGFLPNSQSPAPRPQTVLTYNQTGELSQTTDPLGNNTYFGYNLEGEQTQVVDALGSGPTDASQMTTKLYDAVGNVLGVTDPLGRTTQFQYEALNRKVKEIAPAPAQFSGPASSQTNPTTTWSYDLDGNVTAAVDPLQHETDTAYDGWNLPVSVTDALGSTATAYDELGRVSTATDQLNRTTQVTYDNLGRQLSEIDPAPQSGAARPTTSWTYDADGNVLSMTDPDKHTTYSVYDGLNRRTVSVSALGADPRVFPTSTVGRTTTAYDALGNVTSVTDPAGNTTTFSYDHLNRETSQTEAVVYTTPAGVTQTAPVSTLLSYDADGNLTQKIDADGRKTTYGYDKLNRQIEEDWFTTAAATSAFHTIRTWYDAAGQVTGITETDTQNASNAANYQYAYDLDGRVASVRMAPGDLVAQYPPTTSGGVVTAAVPKALEELDYSYNADGTTKSVTDKSDLSSLSAKSGTTSYLYDAVGDVTQIAQQNTSGYSASGITPKTVNFTYNADGSLDTIARYDGTSNTLAATTKYRTTSGGAGSGYDGDGRLTNLQQVFGATHSYAFQYDAAGNVTQQTSFDGTANYAFDNANELTSASLTGESFSYDSNGNRTASGSTGASTSAANRLTFDGTYTYQYDAEGNRTKRTKLSDGTITVYAWDNRDRLTSVTAETSAGAVTDTVSYGYDSANRQIARYETSQPAVYTVYDGANPYLQVSDANKLAGAGTSTTPKISQRELYALAVDEILATDDDLGTSGSVLWGLADNEGTPRDVVNGSGSLVSGGHIKFTSYGAPTGSTSILAAFSVGEGGMRYDQSTGLYQSESRIYDPLSATWLSVDQSGLGGSEPYAYVGDNPGNATDPTGACAQSINVPTTGYDLASSPAFNPYSFTDTGAQAAIDWQNEYVARDVPTAPQEPTVSAGSVQAWAANYVGGGMEQAPTAEESLAMLMSSGSGAPVSGGPTPYAGYGSNMLSTLKGYFWDGPKNLAGGLLQNALHPIDSDIAFANALLHPIDTGNAVVQGLNQQLSTEEGKGEFLFNATLAALTAGDSLAGDATLEVENAARTATAELSSIHFVAEPTPVIGQFDTGAPFANFEYPTAPRSIARLDASYPPIEGVIDTPRTPEHMLLQRTYAEAAQETGNYKRISQGSIRLGEFSGLSHSPNIEPDFMGLTTDGQIDMAEFRSPSQTIDELVTKLKTAQSQLPPEMRGEVNVVDPKEFIWRATQPE
ncbi:MAG TPA: autotransporter-associated beta strand repeat-containing protein [Pirellulales bacterium]|nr:autotransporter-associated beta strand repeat-containing protein [Pirellulales bacterium]